MSRKRERRRVPRGKSKKLFRTTAQRVNKLNAMSSGPNMRGGIRL